MIKIVKDTQARAREALAKPQYAPFKAAPVMHADPHDPKREEMRKTHMTAVGNYLYMLRISGADLFGELPPAYLTKADDLVASGRRHPVQKVPVPLREGRQIWDEADAATACDLGHAAAIHVILTLPNVPRHEWQLLVEKFVDDHLVSLGIITDWAIHSKPDDTGRSWVTHPHVHLLCTARRWKSDQRKGQRMRCWLHEKTQIDALEAAWLAATGLPPATFTLD
jgi:MobA/MobL family